MRASSLSWHIPEAPASVGRGHRPRLRIGLVWQGHERLFCGAAVHAWRSDASTKSFPRKCGGFARRWRSSFPRTCDKEFQGLPDFAQRVYQSLMEALDRCDAVVAILDGPDSDSGTCIEIAYARAKGKPVIGVRTDFRDGEVHGLNVMTAGICSSVDQASLDLQLDRRRRGEGSPGAPRRGDQRRCLIKRIWQPRQTSCRRWIFADNAGNQLVLTFCCRRRRNWGPVSRRKGSHKFGTKRYGFQARDCYSRAQLRAHTDHWPWGPAPRKWPRF